MMKSTLLILLISMTPTIAFAEIPLLFRQRTFTATTLAEAVNHYVSLGEEAAVRELTDIAPNHDFKRDELAEGFSRPERVGWVCRILFQPKREQPLRPPLYGALSLPHKTMPLSSWPLYPIAASGNSFFVLDEGYSLAGRAEEPRHYLEYCRAEGVFRKTSVPIPTRAEAQKDVLMLRRSPEWRAIKWKDRGEGFSYTISEEWIWKSIQNQADAIK
ncbi:MAG: hypothetical protein IAG10_01020 [Planctomycetaceae bacterium]|nr:hypothetical protein [Planctomycetaceae bacterium]